MIGRFLRVPGLRLASESWRVYLLPTLVLQVKILGRKMIDSYDTIANIITLLILCFQQPKDPTQKLKN